MALPAAQDAGAGSGLPGRSVLAAAAGDHDGRRRAGAAVGDRGWWGASCIDSHDHVITVNRGFLPNGLLPQEGSQSIPVAARDPVRHGRRRRRELGAIRRSPRTGRPRCCPHGIHGCFADEMDNIWIAGNSDGVVQKWTHDGSEMLLQIGTKGVCDGPPDAESPRHRIRLVASRATNSSRTLLNAPADIAVDPNSDPVTGERGSGIHRGRLRQPPHRGLRPRRQLPAPVGLGGERRRPVRGGRRGDTRTAWCSATTGWSTLATAARTASRCSTAKATCSASSRSIRPAYGPGDAAGHRHRALPRDPEQRFLFVVDLGSNRIWNPRAGERRHRRRHRAAPATWRGSSPSPTRSSSIRGATSMPPRR